MTILIKEKPHALRLSKPLHIFYTHVCAYACSQEHEMCECASWMSMNGGASLQ